MQYTLRQMRETVGLSLETYRHWKRVLPSLATRGGRAPCFSIGDLIAASVIYRLTEKAGVRVGHLKDLSAEIFNLCNTSPWANLEGATLAVDLELRTCQVKRYSSPAKSAELILLCQLDPVLGELRDALLRNQIVQDQAELRFPPTAVGAPAERRRKQA